MKPLFFLAGIFCFFVGSAQNLPKVASGKIERLENFQSKNVAARNIDVWLPEGYGNDKKYSVVYMHDGQMLFDSTQTWNKKEWKADEVFSQLIAGNKIEPCIIVAVWNTPERITEYFPNKIFDQIDPDLQKTIVEKYGNGKQANGDNYLKFLINEVKPYIDSHYSTKTDQRNTFIIGSSMGGLISIYAISEYPAVFGGAACLSTAWLSFLEPGYAIPMAAFEYLKKNLPPANDHKIYMDYGTSESNKPYELTQSFVDLIAKGKGFTESNYKSVVYEKHAHDEIAWSKRLNVPVEFIMGNK